MNAVTQMIDASNATTEPARRSDYERIEAAIRYLEDHYTDQPDLTALADAAGISPYHFQRVFQRWVGISPKKFLSFLTLESAKRRLEADAPVLDAAYDVGLSGPGRLHDLFVTLEGVTPGEYKSGGAGIEIAYGLHDGPFGRFCLGLTDRGVCGLTFVTDPEDEAAAIADLVDRWPGARLVEDAAATDAFADRLFDWTAAANGEPLRLFVRGTEFQVQVWRALLSIPAGTLTTYSHVADAVGRPTAQRAVGAAIGRNPVGWLIPCHRVIRASGAFETGYFWGTARKRAMQGWEAARYA